MRTPSPTAALLRVALAALFCLLLVSSASAQATCTTSPTTVSGSFGGGGFGSAPLTQQMTATAVVSGSNLNVTITYTLTPTQPGASVTQMDVVFGAGFTSSVQTSTSANNIQYNVGTPFGASYAPSPAVRLPTTGLSGGAMQAQGTISIPLSGPVVNGKMILTPMVNGFLSNPGANRFSVANNVFNVPTDGNDSQGICVSGFAPCPDASSSSFSASPSSINSGQSATLTWNVPNATQVTIAGVGTFSTASGSVAVTPSSTTTYSLTATGQSGCPPVNLQTTVNVTACQTITGVSASPSSITVGQSTTISWTTGGATSVDVIDLATNTTVASGQPANGSVSVSPSSSRSYRIVANGPCSAPTSDVAVTVCPSAAASSFGPSPGSINPGDSSTLSWNVPAATSVTISGVPGTFGASGSVSVTPPSTTTYTLTANGAAGCSPITLQATVTVAACPTAAGSSFGASPSSISPGGSSTLSWNVPNATSVTISGVAGTFSSSGSVSVSPSATTTYTLTASGPGNCSPVTLQTTVTVGSCPAVAGSSFSASPSSIVPGGSSTLSWNVPNATSVTISGVAGTFAATGSVSVSPSATTTYTLTAAGAGTCSSIQLQTTVTVASCPTAAGSSFSASPTSVNPGGSSTLSWNVPNAASVTISGVAGTFGAAGSIAVTPSATTTYTLTSSGPGNCSPVTLQATVAVNQPPTINSFSGASPVCAGASTTLTWTSTGGTTASITDLTSGVVTGVPVSGSLAVAPATSRSYRLTVTNGAGSVTQDFAVTVTQPASINTFSASATTINAGQSVTFTYNISNTTSGSITDLSTGQVTSLAVQSGTVSFTPATSRTYRLTAANACNSVTQDISITVNQPPTITGLSASPSTVCAGASTTISWTTSGATSATVTDLTSGTVTSVAVNGSLSVTPASTRNYRLTATNAAGSVTQDVTVTVTPAASIQSFTASPSTITPGNGTNLTWTATGTSATITNLTSGGTFSVPVSGSTSDTPTVTTTYRLTVTNSCGTVTQDVTVTVNPSPSIISFTATPTPICSAQSSTLKWTATGGNSAIITGAGLPGSPVSVNPNSGTLVVNPTTTTTYTLTVTNTNDSNPDTNSAGKSVTVTVSPTGATPTFTSATATPSTVAQGGSSTLAWVTGSTTSVDVIDLSTNTTLVSGKPASSNFVVTPASTRTYRILAHNGACASAFRDLTVTVTVTGNVLLGPQGQPAAVGPTSNNDDYTNLTMSVGVAVPQGGVTTASQAVTFVNTVQNGASASDNISLTLQTTPGAAFASAYQISTDGGTTFQNFVVGTPVTVTVAANSNFDVRVRVTVPAGQPVLTAFPATIRATSGLTSTVWNETIDRVYSGFVSAVKTQAVSNSTGVGAATDPVNGAVITYTLTYTNITSSSGTGNVNLTATNLILTEDGSASPNNWATYTNHVPGSASDSLGGTITGDVAGSTLLRDTIPSLGPGQSGVFSFKRVIK